MGRYVNLPPPHTRSSAAGCIVLASLFVGLATGCAPGDVGPAPIVQDSAGVQLVRHGPLADYGRPVYPAEYILTIGDMEGPPEMLFAEVAGVELLDDGTVAVLDREAAEIRQFSPDGSFLRRISRRGSGPGEISGDFTVGLVGIGAGRLLVPDAINQTVSIFDREGSVLESHPWDILQSYMPEWRAASDTTLAVHLWSATAPWHVLAHRSVTGALLDTLAVFAVRPPFNPVDQRWPVWADMLVWSAREPDQAVAGWMSEPWVILFRRGTPARRISWQRDEELLTEEHHEILLDIIAQNMDPGEIPPDLRTLFRLPERLPAVADIETSGELVLVQRARSVERLDQRITYANRGPSGFGGPLWDVFSFEGDYLGVLDLGAPADVFDIRGDTILGVREDSLGVQQPFLARIPAELREGR
ncbi:MAG: hypothetical protein F4179_04225 [Gammaproteobacteria bacterium]|nr:hypothetical protein [Gammaproteobacteria bacterium]MYF60869.1 hypothetical protein [Gammaproteobacteria bacterium]MYI22726.1 hypothetical protein [Gammaproteobacteria bacterium]